MRRFGSTSERRNILLGLLQYRAALRDAGLDTGFQWLDGSFVEHAERIEGRSPNDIDVVTFYRFPAGTTQAQLKAKAGDLFSNAAIKASYHVDGYMVNLGMKPERLIRQSAYASVSCSTRRE